MLEVTNLDSGYGGVPVLRDVSFVAEPGRILLIAGENGAGKSTLLRTIGGFIQPDRGSIRLEGAEVGGLKPEALAARGLRLVLDGHRIFPDISVRDNLRLGGALRRSRAGFSEALEEVFEVFPILKERLNQPARNLSGGQQQILALGQAFVARPRVLLCDEPSLGLAQALLPPILAFLRRWAESGVAVVIVEQHVDMALPVSDHAILLDRGQIRFDGPAEELGRRIAVG